jgi:hypothetical protein
MMKGLRPKHRWNDEGWCAMPMNAQKEKNMRLFCFEEWDPSCVGKG